MAKNEVVRVLNKCPQDLVTDLKNLAQNFNLSVDQVNAFVPANLAIRIIVAIYIYIYIYIYTVYI